MERLKRLLFPLRNGEHAATLGPGPEPERRMALVLAGLAVLFALLLAQIDAVAAASLPGEDMSDKLEAAGTLLKVIDTGLFKWGARIFAGICIMSSAWALKEQRFGIAIICVVGAIIFGTAPKWVKNIFDMGDNQSIFSRLDPVSPRPIFARSSGVEGELLRA